jgi:polar amino acid transport system substrate-binding protein
MRRRAARGHPWQRPTRRPPGFALVSAALVVLALARGTAADAPPFRLCADPDNLPFSAASREVPGFYIELGRAIAARLGRPFEPVWEPTYFARRAVRTSLLKGRCDGFIGLPEEPDLMGPKLIFSKPVLALGYALVLPRGTKVKLLSDLSGRRVAVQFASPPQSMLAARADIAMVTALSPEEAMRDLADGRADAAFIWGPSAGWIDKSTLGGGYDVVPVAGPHMQWRAVIAFPRGEAALRDEVDAAIDALASTVATLTKKYGFPEGPPVTLTQAGDAVPASLSSERSDNAEGAPPPPGRTAALAPADSSGSATPAVDASTVAAGHKLFNENCAHCHGPDAVQGERRRNLRLLHHRYGDEFDQIFMTTVTHGRVTKGMPNWSGILSDEQFQKILTFLHSVQEP